MIQSQGSEEQVVALECAGSWALVSAPPSPPHHVLSGRRLSVAVRTLTGSSTQDTPTMSVVRAERGRGKPSVGSGWCACPPAMVQMN